METLTLKEAGIVPEVPWKLECSERHHGCPGTPHVSQENWLESQEKLRDTIKGWCLQSGTMMNQKGQGITGGDEETPLSVVRPCGMEVPPSEALDISGSPHLTIGYLLKIGCRDLESQVGSLR